MNNPDDYGSTLEAQGWFRDEDGRLTHPIVEAALRWWRSIPPEVQAAYIKWSERNPEQ